ncbi:speckle-type POZ protein-like [Trichogramma pretiosum]|uniref:speckle-type POZ protein-like n=1 Tax=Trichogramma pretiosum TaxID=7493 RepID=UPI0006C9E4DE|nr:speckle-type POZ protein-like [Trichogramma pretiosum]
MSKNHKINCVTEIDTKSFEFTWVIKNYLVVFGYEEIIGSPEVNVGMDDQIKLELNILKGSNEVKLNQYLTGVKDKKVYGEEVFAMNEKDMNELISSEGTVTIHYELTCGTGPTNHILSDESVDTNEVPKLKFDWIFLDENLADIKLRTASTKEIPAHRLMLAAASPVFKAMFSHDMLENKSQSVDINDISYEAALEMLRYIYTGVVNIQEFSLSAEVLAAAEKYQLGGLKDECEKILISTLSAENAIEAIMIANKYNMSRLKKKSVEYVKINISECPNFDEAGDVILSMTQFLSK